MHRSLVSAQEISGATVNFFTDILMHTSTLTQVLEEYKTNKFQQLKSFERMFKVKITLVLNGTYVKPKISILRALLIIHDRRKHFGMNN